MGSIAIDSDKPMESYDVIIVGAGFSGLYQLYHLRNAGLKAHVFEAGNGLGGVWYWNAYPGARVDTEVPCYQFLDPELYENWTWSERYPGRDEIVAYFEHVDKKWNLKPDISFNSRVTALKWDNEASEWQAKISNSGSEYEARAWFVVLCTGFASRPYTPAISGLDQFRGQVIHPSHWPKESEQQKPVDLAGKRIGVLGTGATGIQIIQEASRVASHLSVFQRTPNIALPMVQRKLDDVKNEEIRKGFVEVVDKMRSTFGGFTFEFSKEQFFEKTDQERRAFYDELFEIGGLQYWLGTYKDVLFNKEANETAYQYWREKVLKRIKDPAVAKILAPEKAPHPFGAKRISLEQNYYEIYDQDNVTLIDVNKNPILEASSNSLKTQDGAEHELDVIICATGFDAISGGVTQIDIVGLNNISVKEKWSGGIDTYLGMTTSGFPNLFYIFGPQAPTAFALGPVSADAQGEWIVKCLTYMKNNGLRSIDPSTDAEMEWSKHVEDIGTVGLFSQAKSWYFGDNIPGKKRQCLNYMAGMPAYKEKIWKCEGDGYAGFIIR
jgi:cation diffusion facilitator CzcD-associated flavoprotein CzcO